MKVISTNEAQRLILSKAGDSIFSVAFYRRNDGKNGAKAGEVREMRCRLGATVRKGLAGGPAAYSPSEKGLIWCYLMAGDENRDVDPKNRRSINVPGIVGLKIRGSEYHVLGSPA